MFFKKSLVFDIISSLMNWIFAGYTQSYTGSKNPVQTRKNIQFIKLGNSNQRIQKTKRRKMKKLPSKVAHNCSKHLFQYCQPTQNQPKSQFIFHRNYSPHDLCLMTLLRILKEHIKRNTYLESILKADHSFFDSAFLLDICLFNFCKFKVMKSILKSL